MYPTGRAAYFWLPVVGYAGLIFLFSSFPLPFPPGPEVPWLDKALHLLEYGILGYLLARAFLHCSPSFFKNAFQAWAAIAAILYGFTDEVHQFFVPLRQSSGWDLWCDGIGAILAQWFFRRPG